MVSLSLVFSRETIIFIFCKSICICTGWTMTIPQAINHFIPCFLQVHWSVAQSVVQLYPMIFKSSAGAGGISVSTGCNPESLRTYPHSSASKSHWGSFHWFTCKNTSLLWNLAAAEDGGNDLGSTCVKLVATLSQYFLYQRLSHVSDFFPLYITTNAA